MAHTVGIATEVHPDDFIDMGHKIDSKKLHPIVRALKTAKKGDSLSMLAKEAGLQYITKFNLLIDQRGCQILPSQLLQHYYFTATIIKCPYCTELIETNVLFLHLQHGYKNGHKFDHSKVIKFFNDETNGRNDEIRAERNRTYR